MVCEYNEGLFPYINCECPPSALLPPTSSPTTNWRCSSFPNSNARILRRTIQNHPWQSRNRKDRSTCGHITQLKACELCALTFPDFPQNPKTPLRKYIGINTTHTQPTSIPTKTITPVHPTGKIILLPFPIPEPSASLSSLDRAFNSIGLSANDYLSLLSDNREIVTLSGLESSDEEEGQDGGSQDVGFHDEDHLSTHDGFEANYSLSIGPISSNHPNGRAQQEGSKPRTNWRSRLEDIPKQIATKELDHHTPQGLYDHHHTLIRKLGYKSAAYIFQTARPLN